MKVSVWAGKSQLRRPEQWVDRIIASGCTRVDLIVNDLSAWRVRKSGKVTSRGINKSKHWDTYNPDKLERFAKVAVDAGLEVHTLFWAVPTRKGFISAACWLHTFAETTGVAGHVLDCEEPITKSSFVDYDGDVQRAAAHLASMIQQPLGVTHIGYAPVSKVAPFVRVADYALPQTYLTTTSGLKKESVARLVDRTVHKLGARSVVGGFALYRQPRPDNIAVTLRALSDCGVHTAVGWHAAGLRKYGDALKRAISEYDI